MISDGVNFMALFQILALPYLPLQDLVLATTSTLKGMSDGPEVSNLESLLAEKSNGYGRTEDKFRLMSEG